MDLCKLMFNILVGVLIAMGLILVVVGFIGPSEFKEEKGPPGGLLPGPAGVIPKADTDKYDTQLKVAFYGVAIAGIGVIGIAILGLIAVNRNMKFFTFIFIIATITAAVLLLIFSGVAFAAIALRASAFKSFWRPKMEKWDPTKRIPDADSIAADAMQFQFFCCGLSGENVYQKHAPKLPYSCCAPKIGGGGGGGGPPIPIPVPPPGRNARQMFGECTQAAYEQLHKPACDKGGPPKDFLVLGNILSWASLIVGLYLGGVVFVACCVKKTQK